jgi:hypothetical protein
MKRVWKSNIQTCPWSPTGTIDVGQKVNIEVEEVKRVILTENDLHFYPTQEQLKTIKFVAPKEVYDKLFHSYYNLREITKSGKVKESKLMLRCLE